MTTKRFIELLEDAGYEARSYSGRGMRGKECVAVSSDDSIVEIVVNVLLTDGVDDEMEREWLGEVLKNARTDSLGQILYWPGLEWTKDYLNA